MKSGREEKEYVIEYDGRRKETRTRRRIRRVEEEECVIE
jgi:hypothetical protein